MNKWLLSPEERLQFNQEAHRLANDLIQNTEGGFNSEDIEAIYNNADRAMLQAQDAKTLKAVGEWLEKAISPDELWAWEPDIETLKSGEMPQEVKDGAE